MKNKVVLGICSLALVASSLSADSFSKYAVALKGGTLGGGLEVTTNITSNVNARVGVNAFNYSTSGVEEDIDYDIKLKLLTFEVLADYHPFETSNFRLTGGVMYNGNKLEMNAKPSVAGLDIGDTNYNSTQISNLDVTVDFNDIAPYVGIGFGNAVKSAGFNFVADLGVIFQGTPKSEISVTGTAANAAAADIAKEQADLDDALGSFKVYPVLAVGLSYRF